MSVLSMSAFSTMPRDELQPMLNNWLWEIPPEHAPSDAKVLRVMNWISQRQDAAECRDIIAMLRDYLGA